MHDFTIKIVKQSAENMRTCEMLLLSTNHVMTQSLHQISIPNPCFTQGDLKGGLFCGGHFAITYEGELLYFQIF